MIRDHLENLLMRLTDGLYALIPQPQPSDSALQNCKIVSHRGEHDNKTVLENTLAAFDHVVEQGIWGIELDIRWTRDLYPVVIHDPRCRRVFGVNLEVSRVTLAELQAQIPQLPSLDQVVRRYGKKIHLMVELKRQTFVDAELQRARLKQIFSGLKAQKDFHILALSADLFELVNFLPPRALLPVAAFNMRGFSEAALNRDYAGVSGQYLLLSKKTIRRHDRCSQKTGSGFAGSRNCFYRELNRGVEWIFSNHAIKLRRIRQDLLEQRAE